jgi:hypothetical protein
MQAKSIAEQLLFTTVRIETIGPHHSGVGTAFIIQVPREGGDVLALVTNKHVIEGADKCTLTLALADKSGEPSLGRTYSLSLSDVTRFFVGHREDEIDVTAAPFVPILEDLHRRQVRPFFRAVPSELIPDPSVTKGFDAIEDVVFVGYPNGMWDSVNNLPIVRRGTTATPITVDFLGRRQFLIDASVFPGSSGSPVFLYNTGMYAQKDGGTVVGGRLHFLGLVSSVYFRREEGSIELRPIPTVGAAVSVTREMIDLGLVIKAQPILETVHQMIARYSPPSARL